MLVIPVSDGQQKKFPQITFVLILLNCLVFFGLQQGEEKGYLEAYDYHRASGLFEIESRLYEEFLTANNKELPARLKAASNSRAYFWHMLADDSFQHQLLAHELIVPGDLQFGQWSEKRELFAEKLGQVFSQRFGYSPARKNHLGLFTCMFLHGGFMHLLGNMVFLWFVGSLLEVGIGRWLYLGGYLVTGVAASLAFGLVYPTVQGPLVGASGAIAGLMGAYGLVYGRARIKVFYSLGFYFDYARLPGWLLFPFWLANEFWQLSTNVGSNVAYVAHIGGLLSGAALASVYLAKAGPGAAEQLAEEEQLARVPALLEEGLRYFGQLQLPEARAKISAALEIDPANLAALSHLFNIDKCAPKGEEFHATAGELLGRLAKGKDGRGEIETYFEEYVRLSGSPRLTANIMLAVARSYLRSGKTAEAARYLTILLKQQPQYPGLPSTILSLAEAFSGENKAGQAEKCLQILQSRYAQSSSGRRAVELLSS
ncbi:MAG: rhomboid family intramembrane serine protease [Thermodesulfobacteriota bacterium]